MNVSLTPQMEKFIEKLVRTGQYQTASEVVRVALRMLQNEERLREMELEDLRKEIQMGIRESERGLSRPFTKAMVEKIKAAGRARLTAARRKAS